MRIAVLPDPHGNLHALRAVLAEVGGEELDELVFLGDLVAGPFPRETLELVRSIEGARHIRGNWDDLRAPAPLPLLEPVREWLLEQLDDEAIDWLAAQAFSWSADGTLFVHATPRDVVSLLTERTPDDVAARFVAGVEEELVVAGHLHIQFRRQIGAVDWACAGSIGLACADRPGAYWAVVDSGAVEFRRTGYDLEVAAAAIRASGHPLAQTIADEQVLSVPTPGELLDRLPA